MKKELSEKRKETKYGPIIVISAIIFTFFATYSFWWYWQKYQSIDQLKKEVSAAEKQCEERIEKAREALEEIGAERHFGPIGKQM
jgi:hypothetical protein